MYNGGSPGQIGGTGRGRRFRYSRGTGLVTQQGVPAGVVVVVGPAGEGHQSRIGDRGAVIEHRVDQDLPGHGQASVAGQQRCPGGEPSTAAVAHQRDAARVDGEFARVRGWPGQAMIAVFYRARVQVLGGAAIVDPSIGMPLSAT
jgi:hypothetical protein